MKKNVYHLRRHISHAPNVSEFAAFLIRQRDKPQVSMLVQTKADITST